MLHIYAVQEIMSSIRWTFKERLKYNVLEKGIPLAVRSTVWVCCSSLAGIAVSNPVDVCLLCVPCVVRERFLRRAEHLSRGVLPSVVCLSVISKPQN